MDQLRSRAKERCRVHKCRRLGYGTASKDAVKYYEPEAKANFERCFTPEVMANMNWYPTVPDGLESMEGKTLDKMRAAK